MNCCKLTILANDLAQADSGLIAEHGFAVLLETDELRLLFDTGQSQTLLANAATLGIELDQLDAIAISHGHYDHLGGLPAVLAKQSKPVPVWIAPQAFVPKISTRNNPAGKAIGAPFGPEEITRRGGLLHEVPGPHWLNDSVLLTGPIPRPLPVESASNVTFRLTDDGRRIPDDTPEDQALVIKTEQGLVVVSGCGHAGVANTLHCAREQTGVADVHAFVGGTHLVVVPDDQLPASIARLAAMPVDRWVVGHCTGEAAEREFLRTMPERAAVFRVGTRLDFS